MHIFIMMQHWLSLSQWMILMQMLEHHQHISMGSAMPMPCLLHASGVWTFSFIHGSMFLFFMSMYG